ncbi:MAG: DUF3095 family protein, partial [Alphaproteobacteria bacterium]
MNPPMIEGLSCRWEPLKPTHGVMLTLMAASADGENAAIFTELRKRIQAVLGGDEERAAPVSNSALRFRLPPTGLKLEALARAGRRQFWTTYLPLLLQTLVQGWAERFG